MFFYKRSVYRGIAGAACWLAVLFTCQPSFGQFTGRLNAESVLLIDHETGESLLTKDAYARRPIASLTKLMTLLIAAEAVESGKVLLTDKVKTSRRASKMGGTQVYLKEGEKFTFEEMAYSIAMMSANDAAVAVAEHLEGGEQAFVLAMNQRAAELGMTRTRYTSAHGLPPGRRDKRRSDVSCVMDLGKLAMEAARHPLVLGWTSRWLGSLRDGEFMLYNTNKLLKRVEGMDGMKTGFTRQAGFCYIGSVERGRRRFSAVILDADSLKGRFDLATRLIEFAFQADESLPGIPEA